jgi:hypothetical protein
MLHREGIEMRKRISWLLVALVAATGIIETSASLLATQRLGFGVPAFAIVGRPLTPVSVAGVTRRTVRRCVATVVVC